MLGLLAVCWRALAPHLVTGVAFGLVTWAAFMIWTPAGLVVGALCLILLERKVELDRS